MARGMNARTNIDELAQIDAAEYDQIAIFNALGLDEKGQAELVAAWQRSAPNDSFKAFAGALVIERARQNQPELEREQTNDQEYSR